VTATGHVLRSTRAIVDLSAIGSNVAAIRDQIGSRRLLMAAVKADGYGHGAVEVARVALSSGADCLGVALPEEGKRLREAGIEVPILVLGLIQPDEAYKVVESDLDQTVYSMPLVEALNSEARRSSKKVNIHLKVDTGMGRIGIKPNEAVGFAKRVQRYKNLNLVGVFSHFCTADSADKTFAQTQLQRFSEVLDSLEQADIHVTIRHIANSAAVLDMTEAYLDMVRPGIMIYGLYPSNQVTHSITLEPAMTLVTKVIAIKTVPAGTSISYGRTFITTKKETTIATLPLGYGDGLSRLLSNKAEVLIRNTRAPLVGTICMDMCMVDVSGVKDVKCGDQVTIFGKDPSVEELAEKIGTINYEVTCNVSKRVPRVYSQ